MVVLKSKWGSWTCLKIYKNASLYYQKCSQYGYAISNYITTIQVEAKDKEKVSLSRVVKCTCSSRDNLKYLPLKGSLVLLRGILDGMAILLWKTLSTLFRYLINPNVKGLLRRVWKTRRSFQREKMKWENWCLHKDWKR